MPNSVDLLLHDASHSFNNPVEIAVSEWHNYSGNPDRNPLDLLLSVGTSYQIEPETFGGKVRRRSYFTRSLRLSHTEGDGAADSATIWSRFLEREPQKTEHDLQSGRYTRINVPLNIPEEIEANPAQLIQFLQYAAKGSMHERKMEWRTLSNRLISTSFYFHLESIKEILPGSDPSTTKLATDDDLPFSTSGYICKGRSHRRIEVAGASPGGTATSGSLLDLLTGRTGRIFCRIQTQLSRTEGSVSKFQARLPNAGFRITHSDSATANSVGNKNVSITYESLSLLCSEKNHRGSPNNSGNSNPPLAWHLELEFTIPSRDTTTSISLVSDEGNLGVISAFPRHLVQEWEAAQKGSRRDQLHYIPSSYSFYLTSA